MTGCTQSAPDHSPKITLGKPVFLFDPKAANLLSIAKNDPASGDHWSARVARLRDGGETFFAADPWMIQTYSEKSQLLDRRANRGWIMHFIDTLNTLITDSKVESQASTEEMKSHYGLNPPRYDVQWQSLNPETKKNDSFEIEVGEPVNLEKAVTGSAYAVFPPSPQIYIVTGAALEMLGFLKSFTELRQATLSTLNADDVEEIEIQKGANSRPVYAQRDGNRWTDQKHKAVKQDIAGLLAVIEHLRIARFVDDATEASQLKPLFTSSPVETITLKDRYSKEVKLVFAQRNEVNGKVTYASESNRNDSVFEMYPQTLELLAR